MKTSVFEIANQVATNADHCVGSEVGTGLYVDESAFQKKVEKSAGVARQWNGRLGKQDNCQVDESNPSNFISWK